MKALTAIGLSATFAAGLALQRRRSTKVAQRATRRNLDARIVRQHDCERRQGALGDLEKSSPLASCLEFARE